MSEHYISCSHKFNVGERAIWNNQSVLILAVIATKRTPEPYSLADISYKIRSLNGISTYVRELELEEVKTDNSVTTTEDIDTFI